MNEEDKGKTKPRIISGTTKPRIISYKKAEVTERRPPSSTPPSRRKDETTRSTPEIRKPRDKSKNKLLSGIFENKLLSIIFIMIICAGVIIAFIALVVEPCKTCEINEENYTIVGNQHKINIEKPEYVDSIVIIAPDGGNYPCKVDVPEYKPKNEGTHTTEIMFKNCEDSYRKEWKAVKMLSNNSKSPE